jgi:hypothetical protein
MAADKNNDQNGNKNLHMPCGYSVVVWGVDPQASLSWFEYVTGFLPGTLENACLCLVLLSARWQ